MKVSRRSPIALCLLSLSCSSSDGSLQDSDAGSIDTEIGTPDAKSPSQPDGGTPSQPGAPVRFIAVGDTGKGTQAQRDVGDAMAAYCTNHGCDFVLLLGDNIYESGVESVDDPQWQEKFEIPYQNIDPKIPFHVVLGNHDYGGKLLTKEQGGLGNEFEKGPLEVQYTDYSDRWNMPATFYTLRVGDLGIMMLDTNSIIWDNVDNGDQQAWYSQGLAELSGAKWILAAGHHPFLSNGSHGNAGDYESIDVGGVAIPIPARSLRGDRLKAFFEETVCGTVDMYLSGHDHSRQWVDEPDALCAAPLIVSGAGAETTELPGHGNTTLFEDASNVGFAYVVVDGDDLTLQFVDKDGNVDFEQTISKP